MKKLSGNSALKSQWDPPKTPINYAGFQRLASIFKLWIHREEGTRSGRGFLRGWHLLSCARFGSVMGSFAIESAGGQSHHPDIAQIRARHEENYGIFPAPKSAPRAF